MNFFGGYPHFQTKTWHLFGLVVAMATTHIFSDSHLLLPYHIHLQIHYQFPISDPYSITSFSEKVFPCLQLFPFYDPLYNYYTW
jgi:hypothetical protein